MDDKLYYVESPDGKILGPMGMMEILEGVAAMAILENARICVVGGQEWVELSDVAYTREEEAAQPGATPGVPASETPATGIPVAQESAPPEDELELTPQFDPGGMGRGHIEDTRVEEVPVPPAGTGSSTPFEPPPAAETPVVREATPDPTPAARRPSAEFVQDMPEPAPTPSELPASAFPAEVGEGASDFALDMDRTVESEQIEEIEEPARSGGSRAKWLVPLAVAVALPIVGGVYVMAGGKVPFGLLPEKPIPTGNTPAPTPTAEAPPSAADGWSALGREDAKAALAFFAQAIEENPDDATLHHGHGLAALEAGDTGLALRSLERSLELDATNTTVRTDLGRAQLAAGKANVALATAGAILELDPTAAPALRLRGLAEMAQGNAQAAVQTLTQYTQQRPDDADARRELAMAYEETGRLEPAIEEMTRYLQAMPGDRDAQSKRLEWYRSSGRLAEAGVVYAAVAQARPDDAHAWYLAGLAHPATDEGIRFLSRSLELDSGNADARRKLAEYREKVGPDVAARRPKQTAPTPEPVAPTPEPEVAATTATPEPEPEPAPPAEPAPSLAEYARKIRTDLERESVADARIALEEAGTKLNGAEARRNLTFLSALADFHEGLFDDALAKLDGLDSNASYTASGYGAGAVQNWQARVHLAKGDVRSAIAALDQVGSQDPDEYATARLWEGIALSSLGMTDLAERTWQRAAEETRGAGPAGRGAALSAGFLAGAVSEKDYKSGVQALEGWSDDMYLVLGYAARRTNDNEVARAHFRKALEASRGHGLPYFLARAEVAGTGLTGEWPAE
jgi:tetratricopeptide (TPR) repeat protein